MDGSGSITIYKLDDRGQEIIMHWFHYVVAGLYELSRLPKPVYFNVRLTDNFQRETIELMKPDYIYVDDTTGHTVIPHAGAPIHGPYAIPSPYYGFVRDLILTRNNLDSPVEPFRRIYVSRSRSHELKWCTGTKRRQLTNEGDILRLLQPIGFEVIFLEDYPLIEKIRIFQEAKVLITPSGGALTMCFFANRKSTIVEICAQTGEDMYEHVCKELAIPTARYTNVRTIGGDGNPMTPTYLGHYNLVIHDIPHFMQFVHSLIR
jgi:capsular polysaccharide biosynthesis protein